MDGHRSPAHLATPHEWDDPADDVGYDLGDPDEPDWPHEVPIPRAGSQHHGRGGAPVAHARASDT